MTEAIETAVVLDETTAAPAEKPYKFRKLCADDVFPMFSIIGAVGVNEFAAVLSIADIVASGKASESEESMAQFMKIGLNIASILCKNLPKCRDDIYTLLSQVAGISVDDVRTMDFATFTEMVIDFIRKEEFRDFIGVVSKLFK